MSAIVHVECHADVFLVLSRLWMQKQDKAFTAWLNYLLLPYTPDYLRMTWQDEQGQALTDLRLIARVRGVLASYYRY